MSFLNSFLQSSLNTIVTLSVIVVFFLLTKWIFKKIEFGKNQNLIYRQIFYVVFSLVSALAIAISLPVEQSLKNQLIGLIGIVLSAALAFSSTTLIGNALAGIMNANIKNLNLGDYIRIQDNFGRVTKKGLFRTEIQNEDRNLTSLPNLYIANNPLKIIRESGTIISTTVSLGYDLNRNKVEKLLLEAAAECELTEPYVYITGLGDFSVSYKINGLLTDITKYLTSTSKLNACVMDKLHSSDIEIVSPGFMNQRQVNDIKFISASIKEAKPEVTEKLPEEVIFDKAIKAEKLDDKIKSLEEIENEIRELEKSSKDPNHKRKIEKLKELKDKLNTHIKAEKDKLDDEK